LGSSQPGPLIGKGKVLNQYEEVSSGTEGEEEGGREKEECSGSEEEDSEMGEDAMAPKVGKTRGAVDESRKRTADSTESSRSEESQEQEPEGGRAVRGERPPAHGMTQSSVQVIFDPTKPGIPGL
jgi:hypothetical protein